MTPAAAEELPVETLRSPHSAAVVELTKTRSTAHTMTISLFNFPQTQRVILIQFNYSAAWWPSEGAETQLSGSGIVRYLFVSYKFNV